MMDNYQQFIFKSRYARWIPELGRREEWHETCQRVVDYWAKKFPDVVDAGVAGGLQRAIYNMDVMPSMRFMMTAGPALDRNHVSAYNCSYVAVNSPTVFSEILAILMLGTGVGFSVHNSEVAQLPKVKKLERLAVQGRYHKVEDSREGWVDSTNELIYGLFNGIQYDYDYSGIRQAGEPLKTFGGRASGPEPLIKMHEFIRAVFYGRQDKFLSSLDCHDIVCQIASCVVVGGVRRSALISLSNLHDDNMRDAKSGEWWAENAQRALANNSAIYTKKPTQEQFIKEWEALRASGSGERGIFNLEAAKQGAAAIGRDPDHTFGTNPCGEIILRDGQFCNLTEVVVRPDDTEDDLHHKVMLATVLGTLQSTLTHFPGLRPQWTENTAEERLLGVSLTGICDNKLTNGQAYTDDKALKDFLFELRLTARYTNLVTAKALGIPKSAAITTVKPSGTVSQLVGCSSGIHPAHASKYIRRVRNDNKDPITQLLKDAGVPNEPDAYNASATVFSFPMERKGLTRDDLSAIQFLELWLAYKQGWTDHNPSVTVSVKDDEWDAVGQWVFQNWEWVGGLSFLPFDGGTYVQAPYETVAELPPSVHVNWDALSNYENGTLERETELACTAGVCSI